MADAESFSQAVSMTDLTIDIEKALTLRDKGALFIDVRSPSEFAEATIPGALNIPVFDDDERARVGTVFKTISKEEARFLAVDLVAPKIPRMIRAVAEALKGRTPPVIVFCWRGGMRSKALTTFLDLAGIPTRQLTGGHKAFRKHVNAFLEKGNWGRLLVLRGLTGVGKTRLLLRLRDEGYPVVDLEGLANHRGSAFGAIGLPSQPTQKTFEALLWDDLRKVPPGAYALTEGESRHIGRLILPPKVYEALQVETSLWINASLEYRSKVILGDYPAMDDLKEDFSGPIRALRPRLGGETVDRFLEMLSASRWEELTCDLMRLYYDPLYNHTKPEDRIEIDIEPEEKGVSRLREAIEAVLEGRTL